MPTNPHDDAQERVYVARLPILDERQQVFGYQLLCRAAADPIAATTDDRTSARVLDDALLSVGLDTLTGGRPAFLNLTREVLLTDAATLLPPAGVVFELGADVPADPAVVEACRSLNKRGYALALDDFAVDSAAEALLPYAKFVKVDVTKTPPAALTDVAARVRPSRARIIASQVETLEAYDAAKAAACALFQGYYFCRPRTFAVRAMSTRQLTQLTLIAALNQPHVALGTIEDLLKRDPRLSYRVLRCVNSAAFGLRREVHSIREALLLLGLQQIRTWASIWSLVGVNGGSPELVTVTVLRARCCELLGASLGRPDSGAEYFLLGLCSLLDVILQRPMDAAIEELPLTQGTREALLGHDNQARLVLDAVTHYERGEWDDATRTAARIGLDPDELPTAYHRALTWARQITTVPA